MWCREGAPARFTRLAALAACALLLAPAALAQSARVTGRVIDRESERPIAGAEVELSNQAGGQGFFRARTGADGRFTLERVPPERWYGLTASAPGYADFTLSSWQFPAAQRGAELVIPLDRAGSIEVRVTGSNGVKPVPAAKVAIRAEGGGRWWEGYRPPPPAQWTDAGGVATFTDIQAGAYTVQVEGTGLMSQELRNVAARRGDRTVLAVKLARPAQLAGVVRLIDGSSAAGLSVTARGAGEAVTTTGPDGDFSFGELAPGRFRLEVSHEGFEPASLKEALTLREGESRAGISLTVTPRPAALAFVLHREVFTPGQTVRIGQRSFRVGVVDYVLYRIPDERLLDPAGALRPIAAGDTTGLEREDGWSRVTADGPAYSWREEEFEVPGELEPGAYVLHGVAGALRRRIVFFVSDVGLLVKRSPTRLLVSAASLRTGLPLAGVPIHVVPADPARPTPEGAWSGALTPAGPRRAVTDGRGLALLEGSAGERSVRVVAASAVNGVSVVEAPLPAAAERGGDQVFLYTERPIYRPGQTVYWKAFARRATATGYAMPDATRARLTLTGPEGASVEIAPATLSATGTFDGSAVIPGEAPLGDWSLSAAVGRASGSASLRVQEYRKPEYQVEVEAGQPSYVNGDEVSFRLSARYFFGSPVFGAAVRYTLFESRLRRDDDEGDYEAPVGYGRVLKSGESRLDRDGRVALAFVPERAAYDRTLTLEVEVVDGSNRAVSARGSTVMGRALFDVRVRPAQRVVGVGDAVTVEVTTRDFAGRPVSAAVTLELDQEAWNPLERRYTRSSRPLASLAVTTNAAGHALARLTPAPARSGQLLVRARADDARGNRVTDQASVWVWDARVADYAYRYPTLEAFADRESYSPGDTARVLVNTEVTGASVLAVVEGREIGAVQVVKLEGHTGMVAIPLAAEHAPNCFVALHVRKGKELHSRVLELKVAARRHDLRITLAPDKASYRPREEATVAVETRDDAGSPVAAELSVGVVDEAIYALRRDDTPDPHDVFYGRRPNWVGTVVAFPVLYYGGADKSGQEEVRRDFRDVALWAPTVTTGADGRAVVRVRFPDNLTTWRLTSRGATADTRVGAATAKALVTRDVVARLAGPRAFVAGDRARLVSVVTNRSGAPLTGVEESLEASGAAKLAGAASRKSDLAAAGESRATWAIETPRDLPDATEAEGVATLVLRARSKADADAVETKVPVLPRAVPLRPHGGEVIESASKTVPVALPANLMRGGSGVTVELAASPAAVAFAGLDYLMTYPWSCTEQTANAIRAACAVIEAARSAKVAPPGWDEPAQRLRPHLDRLIALAAPEGGWGWWREGEADPYLTALALDALARADRLGIAPPATEGAIQQGAFRLLRMIDEVRTEDAQSYVAAHLAALLARPQARERLAGLAQWWDATALVLAAGKDRLSPAGQALGAQALAGLGQGAEARALLDALMKRAVTDASGTRFAAGGDEGSWFGDEIESTAYALSALCEVSPQDPRAARIASWLASRRRGREWRSTRTSAPVVMALAAYARTHPAETAPESNVTLDWNGERVLDRSLAADTWRAEPVRVSIPGSKLRPGANTLAVGRAGRAPLFLAWEARALVPSPGPSTEGEKRLRVTREYLRAERTTDRRGRPQILARPLGEGESFRIGDAILVRLTLTADRTLRHLEVHDPRVAGLEVEEALPPGADWPWGAHAEVRDRAVSFFLDRLEAGETVVEYLARAEIAGVFSALPVSAGAMYDPVLQVRGPEATLRVNE